MSVREIEAALRKLPEQELAAFRRWFLEFDAEAWDTRFEDDVAAGRLEKLGEEALTDLRESRTTPL